MNNKQKYNKYKNKVLKLYGGNNDCVLPEINK